MDRVEAPSISLDLFSFAADAPSLSDQLVTACISGDLPSAKAAVAGGASVNDEGKGPGWLFAMLPLAAAVDSGRHDVVVWLLSHGADPNGGYVIFHGAWNSTAAILQLLVDAGGDVNRLSGSRPPLVVAIGSNSEDKVRVLLAQPSLDVTATYDGKTPEQYARDEGKPAVADMIAQEVRGVGCAEL